MSIQEHESSDFNERAVPADERTGVLDTPIWVTAFRNALALKPMEGYPREMTLPKLGMAMKAWTQRNSDNLPNFKLALFGPKPSDKGCLRTNANMLHVSGCEADYDGGIITPQEAKARMRAADVGGLIYTTPSHGLPNKGNRWRIFSPASMLYPPESRKLWVARLNGLFDGALDRASFTPSQYFRAGSVRGREPMRWYPIGGRFIDLANDLDAEAIYPGGGNESRHDEPGEPSEPIPEMTDDMLRDALGYVDPEMPQPEWRNIGFAIHHQTSGSEDGLEIWLAWSRGEFLRNDVNYDGPKRSRAKTNDAEVAERVWKDAGKRRSGKPITAATIIKLTKQAGWQVPTELREALDKEERITANDFEDLGPEPKADAKPDPESEPNAESPKSENEPPRSLVDVEDAFRSKYRGRLLYNHGPGRWHVWDGRRWRPDSTRRAYNHAAEECRNSKGDKFTRAKGRAAAAAAVERLAKADSAFAVEADRFDADRWLLGTPSGVVELRTGVLRAAKPEDYISKLTAVGPGGDCPLWLKFLNEATGSDAEMVRFLQQWFGYCLTGDTSAEKFLFTHGPGGSGKDTMVGTIAYILGDYCLNIRPDVLEEKRWSGPSTEIARLHGARMVWASETAENRHWDKQRITELTGGGSITARFLYQNEFTYTPQFKITVIGNHSPRLRSVDDAIRRRLIVVPFQHLPNVRDESLKERLREEASGILSWLIEGCLDKQRNRFVIPRSVSAYTDEYLKGQDVFYQWLEECCDLAPHHWESTAELFVSWERFAMQEDADPGHKNGSFKNAMRKRFEAKEKGKKNIPGWQGLRLRAEPELSSEGFV